MQDSYEDIINLPHHESKKHPRMSLSERAIQFAPFAALNGFEESIETAKRKTAIVVEEDGNSHSY